MGISFEIRKPIIKIAIKTVKYMTSASIFGISILTLNCNADQTINLSVLSLNSQLN